MKKYIHKVHYYETDKMGICHHSNYVRFMEEARMSFLTEAGYPMSRLESEGVVSPVVSVSCEYKKPCTYDDEIEISVKITEYNGIKLTLGYEMTNIKTGDVVATAFSSHCFINENGRIVAAKRSFPELDAILRSEMDVDNNG